MSILKLLIKTSICAISCANISLLSAEGDAADRSVAGADAAAGRSAVRSTGAAAAAVAARKEAGVNLFAGEVPPHAEGFHDDDDALSASTGLLDASFSGFSTMTGASTLGAKVWNSKYRALYSQPGDTIVTVKRKNDETARQYSLLMQRFAKERKEYLASIMQITAALKALDASHASAPVESRMPERRVALQELGKTIALVKDFVDGKTARVAALEDGLKAQEAALNARQVLVDGKTARVAELQAALAAVEPLKRRIAELEAAKGDAAISRMT